MTPKHFAALLGFATVAAGISFGFGNALLCLLGAAAFYAAALVAQGQLDLGELQDRLRSSAPTSTPPPWPPVSGAPAFPPPRARRVQ
jgi:hypothetical protein